MVTVIAPEALPEIQAAGCGRRDRVASSGRIRRMIWTACSSRLRVRRRAEVNRAVFAEAQAKEILCNAVDDPPFCDFYFPSIVKRGDLQIAISTAGESPALAMRLRKEINAALPADGGEWLMELGRLRREVLAAEPQSESRKALLHQLAERSVCGAEFCPSRKLAREHAAQINGNQPHAKPEEVAK